LFEARRGERPILGRDWIGDDCGGFDVWGHQVNHGALRAHPAADLGHFTALDPTVVELYLGGAMEASDAHD
jgi:hypothetical protein